MFTASGVLNVFRAPLARFSGSGDRVIPTYPNDVKTNSLSQTTVHDVFCTTVRFLLKVASTAPSTKVEDDVEGARCEQTAQCCISAADVILALAGSFDTVSPLYRLKKKEIVHVLCSPTGKTSDDGTPTFRPLKIFAIDAEDASSMTKAFKFEVGEAKAQFAKERQTMPDHSSTPDLKRKAAENQQFASPRWASPPRRSKPQKTDDAKRAGVHPRT